MLAVTFDLILVVAAAQFGFLQQGGFSLSGAAFGIVVTLILFACVVMRISIIIELLDCQ